LPYRTPEQITEFVRANQYRMDLPVQYFGDEPNSECRPWDGATVRWCMVASWPYEAAAGNQSIPSVYKAVHVASESYLCDRFYLPATPRDLGIFEKGGYPVFGIETKRQLRDFDVVATSIAYPVLVMSFHKMLSMSDIPPRWVERERLGLEKFPMVMVGGQAYGAPEILAPIVDCWWLGEVEDEPGNPGIGAVTERISEFKESGEWSTDRLSCYQALAREFRFLYFPRFVEVAYDYEDRSHVGLAEPSKQVVSYHSTLLGMRLPFLKRIVKNLDNVVPLTDPPLLYADPGMGAGDLEVARGCPAWCSFCALTYRQKPYRQRSVEFMTDFAKKYANNMGSTRLAPFSPDFPMHTQRKKLIASLLENVSDEVDAPAMRIDDFVADDQFVLLQVYGGMDGVTLGLEGNSQRMRDLVGKGTSDADVERAVTLGIRAGIRKFKIFMISNLPGEDEGDVYRVLVLARRLADARDRLGQPTVRIQFSWTPLLVEANTPFQWFAPPVLTRVLGDVWEDLRDLKIEFKLGAKSEPNKAAFFQLAQRASREIGEALVDVMDELDKACWGGVPRNTQELLETKLKERGFHNGFGDAFDERFREDLFGWEFIDQGVSTDLLWRTYVQMREFVEDTDSASYDEEVAHPDYRGQEWVERCDTRCYGKSCGCCDAQDLQIRRGYIRAALTERDIDLSTIQAVDQRSVAFKIRARVWKSVKYRFVTNDHWRFNVRRAAYRAQADLQWEHGIAKRTIRFASDGIRHKDWTAGVDYLEFGVTRHRTPAEIEAFLGRMNFHLQGDQADPDSRWIDIQDWTIHPAGSPAMRSDLDLSLFELELDKPAGEVLAQIETWARTDYVKMTLKQEGGYFNPIDQVVNARDYVDGLWLVREGHSIRLRMLVRGQPSPYVVYAALMGRSSWIDAAARPALRLEAFIPVDRGQLDLLRPNCERCGLQVPTTVLDRSYHPTYCPECLDQVEGRSFGFVHSVGMSGGRRGV
jgi:radical SAM superfamily enzyme YgiQ (UPF0313 family)